MKPIDRMRENADKIQDYPELKEVAQQMREDALYFEKANEGMSVFVVYAISIIILCAVLIGTLYYNNIQLQSLNDRLLELPFNNQNYDK